MNQNPMHPYELDVQPGPKPGTFQWTIRKGGKLLQRSDKTHRSADDARKNGEREVEKQFGAAQNPR